MLPNPLCQIEAGQIDGKQHSPALKWTIVFVLLARHPRTISVPTRVRAGDRIVGLSCHVDQVSRSIDRWEV